MFTDEKEAFDALIKDYTTPPFPMNEVSRVTYFGKRFHELLCMPDDQKNKLLQKYLPAKNKKAPSKKARNNATA